MKSPTTNGAVMNETYAVFATAADGSKHRVTDPATWNQTQYTWLKLDEQRRDRRFPTVKYFEVRSMDDPNYKDLPTSFGYGTAVEKSRGFKRVEDAARKAWHLWQGEYVRRGGVTTTQKQGYGGWFYWHNGRAACQGLTDLVKLARSRGLVEQGVDGRWYPMVTAL